MNTHHALMSVDEAETNRLEDVENWQALGMVAFGMTGFLLMLTGIGAMLFMVAKGVGRLMG